MVSFALTTGSDDLDLIVVHLARLNVPFRVVDPPDLRDRFRVLADRLRAAANPPTPSATLER